jgi:dihydrofolate reductase
LLVPRIYATLVIIMRVFAIAAVTVNGFIGQTPDQTSWDWTSPEDRKLLVQLTKEAGTVVLGSKTFDTFRHKRAFPGRRTIIYTRHPKTIDIPDIETTDETPNDLVRRLELEGATGLAVIGGTTIYNLFLASGMLDELYLTIEPIVFGSGIPLFGAASVTLQLLDSRNLNDNTILLHYAVKK